MFILNAIFLLGAIWLIREWYFVMCGIVSVLKGNKEDE